MAKHRLTAIIWFMTGVAALNTPGHAAERRCGWIENPTPANWWLRDRDAEWTISTMGGYQAPGFDDMPAMNTAGWIKTNGSYGYGCGCMVVEVDRATERVERLISATPVPLARCRGDRALPKP